MNDEEVETSLFLSKKSCEALPRYLSAGPVLPIGILDLSKNNIGDVILTGLLDTAPYLWKLQLNDNKISRISTLLVLAHHPNLEELDVRNNPIPDISSPILCLSKIMFCEHKLSEDGYNKKLKYSTPYPQNRKKATKYNCKAIPTLSIEKNNKRNSISQTYGDHRSSLYHKQDEDLMSTFKALIPRVRTPDLSQSVKGKPSSSSLDLRNSKEKPLHLFNQLAQTDPRVKKNLLNFHYGSGVTIPMRVVESCFHKLRNFNNLNIDYTMFLEVIRLIELQGMLISDSKHHHLVKPMPKNSKIDFRSIRTLFEFPPKKKSQNQNYENRQKEDAPDNSARRSARLISASARKRRENAMKKSTKTSEDPLKAKAERLTNEEIIQIYFENEDMRNEEKWRGSFLKQPLKGDGGSSEENLAKTEEANYGTKQEDALSDPSDKLKAASPVASMPKEMFEGNESVMKDLYDLSYTQKAVQQSIDKADDRIGFQALSRSFIPVVRSIRTADERLDIIKSCVAGSIDSKHLLHTINSLIEKENQQKKVSTELHFEAIPFKRNPEIDIPLEERTIRKYTRIRTNMPSRLESLRQSFSGLTAFSSLAQITRENQTTTNLYGQESMRSMEDTIKATTFGSHNIRTARTEVLNTLRKSKSGQTQPIKSSDSQIPPKLKFYHNRERALDQEKQRRRQDIILHPKRLGETNLIDDQIENHYLDQTGECNKNILTSLFKEQNAGWGLMEPYKRLDYEDPATLNSSSPLPQKERESSSLYVSMIRESENEMKKKFIPESGSQQRSHAVSLDAAIQQWLQYIQRESGHMRSMKGENNEESLTIAKTRSEKPRRNVSSAGRTSRDAENMAFQDFLTNTVFIKEKDKEDLRSLSKIEGELWEKKETLASSRSAHSAVGVRAYQQELIKERMRTVRGKSATLRQDSTSKSSHGTRKSYEKHWRKCIDFTSDDKEIDLLMQDAKRRWNVIAQVLEDVSNKKSNQKDAIGEKGVELPPMIDSITKSLALTRENELLALDAIARGGREANIYRREYEENLRSELLAAHDIEEVQWKELRDMLDHFEDPTKDIYAFLKAQKKSLDDIIL